MIRGIGAHEIASTILSKLNNQTLRSEFGWASLLIGSLGFSLWHWSKGNWIALPSTAVYLYCLHRYVPLIPEPNKDAASLNQASEKPETLSAPLPPSRPASSESKEEDS